jgi:2-alkyl-3-oxoalkanoate reductase
MKVMITGATGFFGSYIAELCVKQKDQVRVLVYIAELCVKQKDQVRVLVKKTSNLEFLKQFPGIEYVYGSLNDAVSIERAVKGMDVVYHAAARVVDWGTKKQFMEANYEGTKLIVDACKRHEVKKLVFVSSPSVVFDYKDEIMIDESYPYPAKFANYYSEAKALAEQYVVKSHDPDGLQTVVIRPHALWGPRDTSGFMPRVIAKIKEGKIKDFSGGKKVMVDMCYALNGAEACLLAAKSKISGGKIYFISDDEPVDVCKFFNTLSERLQIPGIHQRISKKFLTTIVWIIEIIWKLPFLAKNYAPPLTKYAIGVLTNSTTYTLDAAKKDLGYNPKVSVEKGLDNLIKWIEEIGGIDEYTKNV